MSAQGAVPPSAALRAAALVPSAAQMRALDRHAIDDLGIPGAVLMENAGRGVADVVARERPRLAGLPVKVVCGSGNNGGDGFVVARHLALRGAKVACLLARPPAAYTGDPLLFLRILQAMDDVLWLNLAAADESAWRGALAGAEVIVDALLGTGLAAAPSGAGGVGIGAMDATPALLIAVDVPSGLHADTGRAEGAIVRAAGTVTMGCAKLGLLLDAEAPVGRLDVATIGAPMTPLPGHGPWCHLLAREVVFPLLPRRGVAAHKGSSGHVLAVAGSPGHTGAAVLAARAALRAGAGLVTIASTRAGQAALDAKVVEAMSTTYADGDDADAASYDQLAALFANTRALVVGPGMPRGPGAVALARRLAAEAPLPAVLDADGLNALGPDAPAVLADAPAPRVLTPHPGEMARLLAVATPAVQSDRLGSVRRLAAATGAVVVLKGARTLVAAPDGTVFLNPVATPSLATAGSGDVLAGVIGALLAQGLGAEEAAAVGVFVHGQGGLALEERYGDSGVLAGDLPEAIADVIARSR